MTDDHSAAQPPNSPRLRSIDALRGFDMFWIIGGDEFAWGIAKLLGFTTIAAQFSHVKWHGFRFYDLIFPLFLFIVGVVLPFSLSKYINSSDEKIDYRVVYRRIVKRTILLIALGLIGSGFLQFKFDEFRWPGVLQRTGICYFFAALAVLHLNVARQFMLFVGLLLGYWCLLLFIPAPGFKPYDLTMEGSLVGYLDRSLIPGRLYYRHGDNEGLLSTLPAIGTVLLGSLAGHWLRTSRTSVNKLLGLFFAAAICLAAGYLWSLSFPLNKNLWTSSFVLVAGGWSLALLALFYWIIDIRGERRWSFFFIVIGMNAITIYVLQEFVDFSEISKLILGGVSRYFGQACSAVCGSEQVKAGQKALLASGVLAMKWFLLWYLHRNKTFLRV